MAKRAGGCTGLGRRCGAHRAAGPSLARQPGRASGGSGGCGNSRRQHAPPAGQGHLDGMQRLLHIRTVEVRLDTLRSTRVKGWAGQVCRGVEGAQGRRVARWRRPKCRLPESCCPPCLQPARLEWMPVLFSCASQAESVGPRGAPSYGGWTSRGLPSGPSWHFGPGTPYSSYPPIFRRAASLEACGQRQEGSKAQLSCVGMPHQANPARQHHSQRRSTSAALVLQPQAAAAAC